MTWPKKIDTVFVDNAAEAHVLALDKLAIGSPIAGKVYFISQGEPVTHEALINAWLQGRRLSAGNAAHAAGPGAFPRRDVRIDLPAAAHVQANRR